MGERRSLAEEAVATLANVARMDFNVTNEHDERHQIRTLKRMAETLLDNAFRQANELVWLAEDVRRTGEQQRSEKKEESRG